MKDWGCFLSQVPARVEARVLDPCEVSFGGSKRYTVEDGNFQRWTRNGSQCPVHLTRWIVIHHEQDRQLVDMWLRSMRELGGAGFSMHFSEPIRLVMSGNPDELRRILLEQITPDIQLVMLFTPQKDSKRSYQILKNITATQRPCITQVVKSETMRKRQSVVAIVTRVIMQISAKLLGPLWHINLDSPQTPMMAEPTMIVGIDTFESKEYPRRSVIGFVASIDAYVSQYFSTCVLIDEIPSGGDETKYYDLVSQKIRLCMHDAFEQFADANDGILPTNIIVYRNNVSRHAMKLVGQFEVEALLDSIKATNSETWDETKNNKQCSYEPALTYIMCMGNVPARFFVMGSPDGAKNPPPGTVFDHVKPGSDLYSFYLVNQHVSRGSAAPTQYVVGYESSTFSVDAIQNLTYRLSHMYYNFPGGVRLPAPAQYAKKLAHMVATSVQANVHPRLRETLYYL
jgi:aubergine